jgi:hypothetical protein
LVSSLIEAALSGRVSATTDREANSGLAAKQARKVHRLLAGPKELYWSVGKHFDFYDQAPTVSDAADRVAAHFRAKLA